MKLIEAATVLAIVTMLLVSVSAYNMAGKPPPEPWADSYEVLTMTDEGGLNIQLFQYSLFDYVDICALVHDEDMVPARGLGYTDTSYFYLTYGWLECEDAWVRFIKDGRELIVEDEGGFIKVYAGSSGSVQIPEG